MEPSSPTAPTDLPLGLRERKKVKTRAAIQEHALRLFREQGYSQTTVEQIAAAAEVSPSTFFRYFPTKEDVVLFDATEPVIWISSRRSRRSLGPRGPARTLHEVYDHSAPERTAREWSVRGWCSAFRSFAPGQYPCSPTPSTT